jgi:hypothetical protein
MPTSLVMNEFGQLLAKQRGRYWQPVPTAGLVALVVAGGWLMLLHATDGDGYMAILDDFNLIVHEAGHPIFGAFGESAGLWGGTLAQLLLPLLIAGAFLYERAALSFCFAMVWFFENFLNVARYIADARAQELPLVGGGEHDWNNILSRHDLLDKDTQIASVVSTIGWVGMVASLALAVGVWYAQQRSKEHEVATQQAVEVERATTDRPYKPV